MGGGEMMDLLSNSKEATLDELRWIHRHKTGALLETAVTSGAILGGMNFENEVPALEQYATAMGLAFQAQDDILDITTTSENLGKTAGKDVDQNKATYPKLMGLEGARQEVQQLYNEAVGALSVLGEHGEPLKAIANYVVNRCN